MRGICLLRTTKQMTNVMPGTSKFCVSVLRVVDALKKAALLQAWSGPEGSRKFGFPDFVTMAQDIGRLSALRTGHLYP